MAISTFSNSSTHTPLHPWMMLQSPTCHILPVSESFNFHSLCSYLSTLGSVRSPSHGEHMHNQAKVFLYSLGSLSLWEITELYQTIEKSILETQKYALGFCDNEVMYRKIRNVFVNGKH